MMRQTIAFLLLSGFMFACQETPSDSSIQHNQPLNSDRNIMSNKEIAQSFVQAALSSDIATVKDLVDPDYIQHNPFIPTGRESFIGLFPVLQENGTGAKAVRSMEDSQYVVLHHLWTGASPFGADEMVSFDILRFNEEGKIAEHWDAMMPMTPPNPSGRTLLDGATEVADADQTETNKAIAKSLFETIVSGDQDAVGAKVQEIFLPGYAQHSPTVADGIPAVFEAFAREQWIYHKNHLILGEGNFVLSVSEGTARGVHSVFYDLLRFEEGKVAEHWDVIQAIPTENLANDNTMFGF